MLVRQPMANSTDSKPKPKRSGRGSRAGGAGLHNRDSSSQPFLGALLASILLTAPLPLVGGSSSRPRVRAWLGLGLGLDGGLLLLRLLTGG